MAMSRSKKMTVIPVDQIQETPITNQEEIVVEVNKKENSIRKYALSRQRKIIHVILKLAKHGSYDEEGFLLRPDGSKLEDADFISLLLYCMSPGRSVKGLNDFISILTDAGITPDDVINIQVKELLHKNRSTKKKQPVLSQVVHLQDHDYRGVDIESPVVRGPPQLKRAPQVVIDRINNDAMVAEEETGKRKLDDNSDEEAVKAMRSEDPWEEDDSEF